MRTLLIHLQDGSILRGSERDDTPVNDLAVLLEDASYYVLSTATGSEVLVPTRNIAYFEWVTA